MTAEERRSSGARRVAPFISKLYEIAARFPEVCGFGESGDTVIVHDPKASSFGPSSSNAPLISSPRITETGVNCSSAVLSSWEL